MENIIELFTNSPIGRWMDWEEILTNDIWDMPTHVIINILILVFILIAIAIFQLVLIKRKKSKTPGIETFLWITTIIFFVSGIGLGIKGISTLNTETQIFGNLVHYHSITSNAVLASTGGSPSIVYFRFTSEIYRTIAIVVVGAYLLIILALKAKTVFKKVICGILVGLLLSGGGCCWLYSKQETAYWNNRVLLYYTGKSLDKWEDFIR